MSRNKCIVIDFRLKRYVRLLSDNELEQHLYSFQVRELAGEKVKDSRLWDYVWVEIDRRAKCGNLFAQNMLWRKVG